MAFKIPNFAKQMGGSPFAMKSPLKENLSGTSNASQKSPYERALEKDSNLPSYIKERKKQCDK